MDLTDTVVAGQRRPVALGDLAGIPLRRWRWTLAAAGLVVAAAAGYLLVSPVTYTGTSVVVIRPVVTDPFSVPNGGAEKAVNMTAENGIATGNEVVDAVAKATRRSPAQVADSLTVENPVGGLVLRFGYDGRSAAEAVTGANGAAQAYLTVRRTMYEVQRTAVLKSYDGAIGAVTVQRRKAQQGLAGAPGGQQNPRSSAVLDQMRSLNDQLAALAEQRSKVASAELTAGVVTNAARDPLPSSRDQAPLYLVAALLGGLLVGAVVAFARESMDRRVRTAAEAAEVTGGVPLGSVLGGGRSASADMRYFAMAVASRIEQRPGAPLVLLSERADEGRAQVSVGLAVALAEAGHEVYLGGSEDELAALRGRLLAAQRRTPPVVSRHRLSRPGPAEPAGTPEPVAVGAASSAVPGAAQTATWAAPAVPVGPDPTPPRPPKGRGALRRGESDLVPIGPGSVRIGPLELENPEPVVILDAPAAAEDDSGVWAARAGQVVLVARRDHTPLAVLARLAERVRAAGVEPLGVVLTGGRR